MNLTTALLAVPAALAIGFAAGRTGTFEAPAATAPLQDQDQGTVAALDTTGLYQPGDFHRMLDVFVGDWNAKVMFYVPGMDEPQVNEGTMTGSWIMGGRFLKQAFQMPMSEDETFEGMSLMGYSPAERVFESVWIDNMVVDMASGAGYASPDGMRFTMLTSEIDPESMVVRELEERISITSNSAFDYERVVLSPEGESLQMRIEYTRVAPTTNEGR
jgi:hypothetical protein